MKNEKINDAIRATKIALKHVKSNNWSLNWAVNFINVNLDECTTRQACDQIIIKLGVLLRSISEKDAKKRTLLAIMQNFRASLPSIKTSNVKSPALVEIENTCVVETMSPKNTDSLLLTQELKFWDDQYLPYSHNNTLH